MKSVKAQFFALLFGLVLLAGCTTTTEAPDEDAMMDSEPRDGVMMEEDSAMDEEVMEEDSAMEEEEPVTEDEDDEDGGLFKGDLELKITDDTLKIDKLPPLEEEVELKIIDDDKMIKLTP